MILPFGKNIIQRALCFAILLEGKIFFHSPHFERRPTMNDNSSATIKTSHRTKVFTFLTLDECVGGSLVILPFGKNIIQRALILPSFSNENNFFTALASKERRTVNGSSSATIKTGHRTNVFTFLTLDECVEGSVVIVWQKNIIQRALRFTIFSKEKPAFTALKSSNFK